MSEWCPTPPTTQEMRRSVERERHERVRSTRREAQQTALQRIRARLDQLEASDEWAEWKAVVLEKMAQASASIEEHQRVIRSGVELTSDKLSHLRTSLVAYQARHDAMRELLLIPEGLRKLESEVEGQEDK